MPEFEVGDVVQLKSGGPNVTVRSRNEIDGDYHCQWFAGSKLSSGWFVPEALVKVEEDEEE